MLRSKLFFAGLIAVVLSLVAVERSEAQVGFTIGGGSSRVGVVVGRPWYGGNYGGYYGRGYGYYQPYGYYGYSPSYYNYDPGWYSTPGVNYYPPTNVTTLPAPTPVLANNTATIEVIVPANAELWFDGNKTTQTGTQRFFVTPPLTAGTSSTYEVRATWVENGAPVTQARMIQVQPGQQSVVNLTK